MLQTVASLIDEASVIIYDYNVFTIQAAGLYCKYVTAEMACQEQKNQPAY
jgi:hypothetical protein